MSILKLTHEIAHDIKEGKMTREEALTDYGHLIDMETLDEVLESLDRVRHEEDVDGEDIIVFTAPEEWGWEPPQP